MNGLELLEAALLILVVPNAVGWWLGVNQVPAKAAIPVLLLVSACCIAVYMWLR